MDVDQESRDTADKSQPNFDFSRNTLTRHSFLVDIAQSYLIVLFFGDKCIKWQYISLLFEIRGHSSVLYTLYTGHSLCLCHSEFMEHIVHSNSTL